MVLSATMNRKTVLSFAVASLGVIALLFAAYPFLQSLSPSARAIANVPAFELKFLPEDELTIIEGGFYPLFVYRSTND